MRIDWIDIGFGAAIMAFALIGHRRYSGHELVRGGTFLCGLVIFGMGVGGR